MFGEEDWLSRLMFFIPLLLSLGVHEWAHAWSAWLLGDDTARLQGRMSLNPFVHVDPLGTLLLPLIGFPIGWAKPVPFEPLRFRRRFSMRTGTMIVAAAGPISNVCLAALSVAALAAIYLWGSAADSRLQALSALLQTMVLLNILLALFNLLPIPPLDGSRVVDSFLPDRFRPAWGAFWQWGPLVLLAVILLPALAGESLFSEPVRWIQSLLIKLQVELTYR